MTTIDSAKKMMKKYMDPTVQHTLARELVSDTEGGRFMVEKEQYWWDRYDEKNTSYRRNRAMELGAAIDRLTATEPAMRAFHLEYHMLLAAYLKAEKEVQ